MNRLDKIRNILREIRSIDIITLSEELGVSHVTVRKDLDKLQEEGFLIKSHGMVMLSDKEMQQSLKTEVFEVKGYDSKSKLAEFAKDLIDDGDSIFIGGGPTCYLLSKSLAEKNNIRVVTNNINAVLALNHIVNHIYLIGGEIVTSDHMQYASGYMNYEFLKGVFVNKAFLHVDGIDSKAGLTVNDLSLSKLYQYIKEIAKEIIVFGDDEVLERIGMYQIGKLDFADAIISNHHICDQLKAELYGKNIKLYSNYNL
ncbi:MAG: DeoR/GlpR transcriptional regulator [Vallitaleaceae bacterium]|nr:DeoR/GlpR transcriptional regulator [Vallitaleaceae bacterium]